MIWQDKASREASGSKVGMPLTCPSHDKASLNWFGADVLDRVNAGLQSGPGLLFNLLELTAWCLTRFPPEGNFPLAVWILRKDVTGDTTFFIVFLVSDWRHWNVWTYSNKGNAASSSNMPKGLHSFVEQRRALVLCMTHQTKGKKLNDKGQTTVPSRA